MVFSTFLYPYLHFPQALPNYLFTTVGNCSALTNQVLIVVLARYQNFDYEYLCRLQTQGLKNENFD